MKAVQNNVHRRGLSLAPCGRGQGEGYALVEQILSCICYGRIKPQKPLTSPLFIKENFLEGRGVVNSLVANRQAFNIPVINVS
jgi:hypothetical protein